MASFTHLLLLSIFFSALIILPSEASRSLLTENHKKKAPVPAPMAAHLHFEETAAPTPSNKAAPTPNAAADAAKAPTPSNKAAPVPNAAADAAKAPTPSNKAAPTPNAADDAAKAPTPSNCHDQNKAAPVPNAANAPKIPAPAPKGTPVEPLKLPNMDLYIPRKCSATNRLITSKDHASVQLNIGHLDSNGVYNNQFTTFALCGFIRAQGDADSAIDRLWQKKRSEIKQ